MKRRKIIYAGWDSPRSNEKVGYSLLDGIGGAVHQLYKKDLQLLLNIAAPGKWEAKDLLILENNSYFNWFRVMNYPNNKPLNLETWALISGRMHWIAELASTHKFKILIDLEHFSQPNTWPFFKATDWPLDCGTMEMIGEGFAPEGTEIYFLRSLSYLLDLVPGSGWSDKPIPRIEDHTYGLLPFFIKGLKKKCKVVDMCATRAADTAEEVQEQYHRLRIELPRKLNMDFSDMRIGQWLYLDRWLNTNLFVPDFYSILNKSIECSEVDEVILYGERGRVFQGNVSLRPSVPSPYPEWKNKIPRFLDTINMVNDPFSFASKGTTSPNLLSDKWRYGKDEVNSSYGDVDSLQIHDSGKSYFTQTIREIQPGRTYSVSCNAEGDKCVRWLSVRWVNAKNDWIDTKESKKIFFEQGKNLTAAGITIAPSDAHLMVYTIGVEHEQNGLSTQFVTPKLNLVW